MKEVENTFFFFFKFYFNGVICFQNHTDDSGPGCKKVVKATGRQVGAETRNGRELKLLGVCCRPPTRVNASNFRPRCSVPVIHMPLSSAGVRHMSTFVWAEHKALCSSSFL